MLKPWKGHEWGAKKVESLLDWVKDFDVKEITLYAFSMQNFNRPKKEFNYLMDLMRKEFKSVLEDKRVYNNKIRINFIGRTHLLPEDIQDQINAIMDKTRAHNGFILNFAIAYGGREEVIDAVMRIGKEIKNGKLNVEAINEDIFKDYLYTSDEPDLIIRTGGDHRTSNFLIWQSNYSEWFFLEKTWPEFEKEDLAMVIEQFQKRERRFGR